MWGSESSVPSLASSFLDSHSCAALRDDEQHNFRNPRATFDLHFLNRLFGCFLAGASSSLSQPSFSCPSLRNNWSCSFSAAKMTPAASRRWHTSFTWCNTNWSTSWGSCCAISSYIGSNLLQICTMQQSSASTQGDKSDKLVSYSEPHFMPSKQR